MKIVSEIQSCIFIHFPAPIKSAAVAVNAVLRSDLDEHIYWPADFLES